MGARKGPRKGLWIAASVFAVVALAYVLRWPLLEGVIARAIQKKVSSSLNADITFESLGGSLISSARVRNITLIPRPGSPLRAGEIERLDVRYGFLGTAGLRITAQGVRIELAPSDKPPGPVHEVVRGGLASVHGVKVPGVVKLLDAKVVLGDGREIAVERALVAGKEMSARIHTEEWGTLDLSAGRGSHRALWARGSASRGPVTQVRLDLGPAVGSDQPLAIQATVGRENLVWTANVRSDAGGLLETIEGELKVRQGRAASRMDFRSGLTEIDIDGQLTLEKAIAARVAGRVQVRGSMADAPERWTVSGGFLKVESATFKGCPLSGEITFSEGTLARLPWRGSIRCNEDRLEAEGTLSWKERAGINARLTLDAADLSSYKGLLPEKLKARAREIHLEGTVEVNDAGPAFDGLFTVGAGEVEGIRWDSVRWAGRITPNELVVRELKVNGLPGAPQVALSGRTKIVEGSNPRRIDIEISSPKVVAAPAAGELTGLVLKASLDDRGLDVQTLEGSLDHGPFRAIGRWDFKTPEKQLQLHLVGHNMLVVTGNLQRVRASPNLWASGNATKGWRIDGEIGLPSIYYYGELGDPHAARQGKVKEATAPKIHLPPAPGGGFELLPVGLKGGEDVALDIDLKTSRNARIENSSIGALLQADLHLGGTLAVPALSGNVRVRQGEVKLATGVFIRIERAEILLPRQAGQAGTIYFKGRSGKGQGAITVIIAGPLEDPALTLSSDPPRKQEELLAYLAFGRLPGTVTGEDALGTLAVKAFEKATDSWPKAERKGGFWDKFNLSVASEDAPDPDKRVPWQLPPAASARGTIVRTEYLLNSYLSVVVESDRQANVSGDFKVRLHFR